MTLVTTINVPRPSIKLAEITSFLLYRVAVRIKAMCVKVLHKLKACHILFGGQEYQINPSVENLDLSKYSTVFLIFSFPSPYFICKINNSRIHCICMQTYKKTGFSYTFTDCFYFSFTIFLSSYLSYKIKWPLKINCSGLADCFLFWESSSINWCSEISLTVTSLIAELNFFAPLLRGVFIKDSPWFVGESGSWIAIRKRLVSVKPAWIESFKLRPDNTSGKYKIQF